MKKEPASTGEVRIMLRHMEAIPVQTAAGVRMINPEELLYAEIYQHETCFVFAGERIESTVLPAEAESLLAPLGFFRCHRNYFVSFPKVTFIGKEYITMENGDSIPLSMQRRDDFLAAYTQFTRMN